jgi:hypothetical protein
MYKITGRFNPKRLMQILHYKLLLHSAIDNQDYVQESVADRAGHVSRFRICSNKKNVSRCLTSKQSDVFAHYLMKENGVRTPC